MTIPTFNPAVAPSPGTQRTPEIALNKASFGDGYTQASPKGLNHIRRVLTLKWDGLAPDEGLALESFFAERGGYKPFWYEHHSDGVRRKWTCESWSGVSGTPNTFTATLKEDFSNVA